jgi:16S rRNA (cytidine1402-2'-O)-methyltransferase
MAKSGKLYLIPNTLGGETISDLIPVDAIKIVNEIRFFAVEEIKSARRLLRKMDREFPIDQSTFFPLNKHSGEKTLMDVLLNIKKGENVGVISEAGCPGVADPGAELVNMAHSHGIEVVPFVGPSSFLLALMGSGFSGQQFAFHGYLPKDRKDRIRKLKDFEMDCRRTGTTHIFMDTPFRNMHVLEDLLNELSDSTELCIASNLTLPNSRITTLSIRDWREKAYDLSKSPAVFLIGRGE